MVTPCTEQSTRTGPLPVTIGGTQGLLFRGRGAHSLGQLVSGPQCLPHCLSARPQPSCTD